jgi:hypothetical protein
VKKKRISEGRKQIKREGRKQTIELKNQCVSEFLFVLQVTMTFIASIERKRGENSLRSTIFLSSPETAYEPLTSGGDDAWSTCATIVIRSFNTVPDFSETSPIYSQPLKGLCWNLNDV